MRQRFRFSDQRFQQLLEILGRQDAPAQAYLAELESLARAFPLLMEPTAGGLPQSVVTHLSAVSRAGRDLQRRLYELPADARDLLTLHLISETTGRALGSDLNALEEPLGDLVRISRSLIEGGPESLTGEIAPAERLLRIAARAYRNHFNINVTREADPAFERSLACMLEALAEHGVRSAGALADRLPAMCRDLRSDFDEFEAQ